MNQNLIKNDSPASDSAKKLKEFRRNPSPGSDYFKALVVVQDLSWASFFPLVSVFFKHGPISIYYFRAARGGLKLGSLLHFLRIAVSAPMQITDIYYCDTPHAPYWKIQYQVVKACRDQLDRIEALIGKYHPTCTIFVRKLLATNVTQAWQSWLIETLLLRATAKQLGEQEGVSCDQVILVSSYASLLKILNLDAPSDNSICISSHPNKNKTLSYPLATVGLSAWEVIRACFRSSLPDKISPPGSSDQFRIGVSAAWGTEGDDKIQKDDLFWWRNSSVASDRLLYMFEREDIQPTKDRVKQVQNLGIESVALTSKFLGDNPGLLIKNRKSSSFLVTFKNFCFALKLARKTFIADEFSSAVLALVNWQYFIGRKLSDIYKTLNLKGVFHFEEAGIDVVSLASVMNDSMRIGTHWASHTGINQTSSRSHQVYFLWGDHDTQLVLDTGSMSRTLLISGCFLSDHSNKEARQHAETALKEMRKEGARYTLTLFDSSTPCPEFYRFFLQWLVDDPCLGLLIKSKGKSWNEVCGHGLNGLVDRAKRSNRIHVLDLRSSPADAALLSDFAIGVTAISALVVSALQGARVIFLDYERIDQGLQKPYCILHSLGSNRCVFYEPEVMRQALMDYFENPTGNPSLGDATPILDQLDPFRDGKASQRIGEFVSWYLEELNDGLNADDAIRSATEKYANKWGADKVIRRI
jgi:hypothetical protein